MGLFRRFLILLLPVVAAVPAGAEDTRGQVRAQGQILGAAEAPAALFDAGPAIDYREEMRAFVERIAAFARGHRPQFIVVAAGGLALINKGGADHPSTPAPARRFMAAIDGVLIEGLNSRPSGGPAPADERKALLALARQARDHGLKVLVKQSGIDAELARESVRALRREGFIAFLAEPAPPAGFSDPPLPRRPIAENPRSVLALADASNFAEIADSRAFGREDAFALAMHDTNFDVVIVDVFHGRQALSRRAVETLRYKKIGARRLVLARIDIGIAAADRYYWKRHWREGFPEWVEEPLPGDPDRHHVRYWRSGWQKIVFGDADSYVYGAIDQGFDGVVLAGLDVFRFFETGGEPDDDPGRSPVATLEGASAATPVGPALAPQP